MQAYLDYNATSPIDPAVFEAMKPFLAEEFGNPSSFHQKGQIARNGIEKAREAIAGALSIEPNDLIFTSGGTESDNLALRGVVEVAAARREIVVSAIEHQAVLYTAKWLEARSMPVKYVPVNPDGIIDLEALRQAITDKTALVSVMHVNNETGAIQPIREIAAIAHDKGALFHTDAVQSFCRLSLPLEEWGIDLATFSAHKICGPKGAGALYARKGIKVKPVLHGGHQEKNIRPGTENVPGIVGFGAAAAAADRLRAEESARVSALRDKLETGIFKTIEGVSLNGNRSARIYNTLNVSFEGLDGETILMNLDLKNICVSTGSACTAGSVEASHVLLALGIPEKMARAAIRFSLGRFTTSEEIEYVLAELPVIVSRLRRSSTATKR